jgi:hypothetical protein
VTSFLLLAHREARSSDFLTADQANNRNKNKLKENLFSSIQDLLEYGSAEY